MDAQQADLVKGLASGFGARGKRAQRVRAALAVALDFWTWQRLKRAGLDDEMAADLMAELVATAASAKKIEHRRGERR